MGAPHHGVALVAIGDEVLNGFTVNSNASFLAQTLMQAGWLVERHEVVGDDPVAMSALLEEALRRWELVITTGGLGPTVDDRTREVLQELFGPPTRELPNALGTAPGLLYERNGARLIALPGVPLEMRQMALDSLLPLLGTRGERLYVCQLQAIKLCELDLDPLLRSLQNVQAGIYPGHGILTVQLKAMARSSQEFAARIAPARAAVEARFGRYLVEGKVEEAIQKLCVSEAITVALAESCTGGAIAARLVAVPGASQYVQGGVVAYTNAMKVELLDVDSAVLEQHGAVSREVVLQMAEGVRRRAHSTIGVAVSGIAGPSGGTPEKPVGLVWAAIVRDGHAPLAWQHIWRGNRELVLTSAVQDVLNELLLSLR